MIQEEKNTDLLITENEEKVRQSLQWEQSRHERMLLNLKKRRIECEKLRVLKNQIQLPQIGITGDLSNDIKFYDRMMVILFCRAKELNLIDRTIEISNEIKEEIAKLHRHEQSLT